MNTRVIYTCLTGRYDRLEQPAVIDPSWDYICFTEADGQDGVWQLRRIPLDEAGPVRRSRYPKILPHKVLADYEYSLYLDANLQIADAEFYRMADKRIAEKTRFAQVEHPWRDCVYEELRYCYLKDRISTLTAFRLHRYWVGEALPRHAGLYENNLILRAHNDPEIIALDEAWWNAFVGTDRQPGTGGRDQLALQPVFLRTGFQPALLLGPGLNARNVSCLRYTLHPRTGKENTPGRLTWGNVKYRLRLGWRKWMLHFLR